MNSIAVVTSNRAEYGILTPLLNRINEASDLKLDLIVTGAHLSHKYGYTIEQIREDGFDVDAIVPILEDEDSKESVSLTIANAIKGFAKLFNCNRPDILVLLGDRTELLGVAIAAMNENIPIAHICGGEVTEGAVDDCVRHALTKLSYIHFTGTEVYRKRVIQMGENPDRVFNVGSLSAENILNAALLTEEEIRKTIGITENMQYVVVTLHPETICGNDSRADSAVLCDFMRDTPEFFYVITASNSDAGGSEINDSFNKIAEEMDNCCFVYSLGMKRYLSAIKYAAFVLGNSSSGIVEAPIMGTPTINIGDRQKGRLTADTIINVPIDAKRIKKAVSEAMAKKRIPSTIYGDGSTSRQIVDVIDSFMKSGIELKKGFYDL